VPFGRAGCFGASQSSGHLDEKFSGRKSGLGAGANFSATERAHKRNGGQVDAE
jgi:hypothetical protein